MSEDKPSSGAAPQKRDYHKWIAGVAVPIVVAVIGVWKFGKGDAEKKTPGNLTVVTNISVIANQYLQYTGKPLEDASLKETVQSAVNLALAGQYKESRALFEQVASRVPVPAVYNNLGALRAELGDMEGARKAYVQAFAKDPQYAPARANQAALEELETSTGHRPVARGREVEPNNQAEQANVLPLGTAVAAEVANANDKDYFRFVAPDGPRDKLRVAVHNPSATLKLVLQLFDENKRPLGGPPWGAAEADVEGELSVRQRNAYYAAVFSHGGASGPYTITVTQQKAFDSYEPNDDLDRAKTISLGAAVQASILDAEDSDCYQVRSNAARKLSLTIQEVAPGLRACVELRDEKRNPLGGWFCSTAAGAHIEHSFESTPGLYYVRVFGHGGSTGSYRLTLR